MARDFDNTLDLPHPAMLDAHSLAAEVRRYVLDQHLPGEDPAQLGDDTALLTSGVIDSLGTLQLVEFLEQRYRIQFGAGDIDRDLLNTIGGIVQLLQRKLERSTP